MDIDDLMHAPCDLDNCRPCVLDRLPATDSAEARLWFQFASGEMQHNDRGDEEDDDVEHHGVQGQKPELGRLHKQNADDCQGNGDVQGYSRRSAPREGLTFLSDSRQGACFNIGNFGQKVNLNPA